jgi:hypothetical protein
MRITKWGSVHLLSVTFFGLLFASCTVSTGGSSSKPTSLNSEEKVRLFASANFDRLKEDMAAGQGEHLASLATLLSVPQSQQSAFFSFTKANFSLVCPSEHVTPDELVAALTREMSSRPQFRAPVEQPS